MVTVAVLAGGDCPKQNSSFPWDESSEAARALKGMAFNLHGHPEQQHVLLQN